MNKRQKALLVESLSILTLTAAAVLFIIHLKQWASRSEAIQVMKQLGQIIIQYHKENGQVPSEDHIRSIKENLEGQAGFDKLYYRAQWIDLESAPDEILAYMEEKFHRIAA